MADRPVLIDLGGGGPSVSYQLAPGEAFHPETITAEIDASGAGGDVVGQVTLIAQSGEILSRTRTDDVLTAGDVAGATFAPF